VSLGHTRTELRAGARAKLDDAILLFENKRYSNAYYLSGYAVELGLKACVAAQMTAETIPGKEVIKGILEHQASKLVGLAGLKAELKEQQDNDPDFAANWAVASEWMPDSRYEVTEDPISSQALISAIADPKSGVFNGSKRTGKQRPSSRQAVR
jgi:HEPN domain-containing protein